MRKLCLALVLVLAAACGGGDEGAPIDADLSLPVCTGVVFDACTDNAQCTSANCHLFRADAIQVCTQACSAAAPCPNDASGAPGVCNNMGICKPARSNACRPPS